MQVRLNVSGLFQVHYGSKVGTFSDGARMGFENGTGTGGGTFRTCGAVGAPTCVDLKTGALAWRKDRGPGNGTGSAALACADGHLYFRYQNGVMALAEATPAEFKDKGTFRIPNDQGPSWSHPVIAGGKLYLRSGDRLLCYNVKQ